MKDNLVGLVLGVTAMMWPQTSLSDPAEPSGWTLVWSDEFDGNAIDQNKWGHDIDCWGGGNNERQCYTASPVNSFVAGGFLTIAATRQNVRGDALPLEQRKVGVSPSSKVTKPFASARLTTKGKADWRYGRVSVRARLPEGQGAWPAIWMLPASSVYGPWAASGEIDIMEAVNLGVPCSTCVGGVEDTILGTLHYGGAWPNNLYTTKTTALPKSADGFHTYSIDWTADTIIWAIDDVAYANQSSTDWHKDQTGTARLAPFDQNFYLILNLAIGGNLPEGRNLRGVSSKNFPKTMQVDWVRIFQCSNPNAAKACQS